MSAQTIYDIPLKDIDGNDTSLAAFQGKALLIVNVASRCGLTPQYEGLEALWRKHKDDGLVVLGFPCNQFGAQEPGTEEEIKGFCSLRYDVTFPMFAKLDVNGDGTHPLYQHLKGTAEGGADPIPWNFTKFLVGRDGRVLKRIAPTTAPDGLGEDLAKALA